MSQIESAIFRPQHFEYDSADYEVLYDCARAIRGVPGFTCEIGLRLGGGSESIIQGLIDSNDASHRIHIGIDPYGHIPFDSSWDALQVKHDYTNKMKQTFLRKMYQWCDEINFEFLYFPLEDSEFFTRYADGVPVYNETKELINQYALVHLDGPHTPEFVMNEARWFSSRMPEGAILIVDDVNFFQNYREEIHQPLLELGFQPCMRGAEYKKIAYIKDSQSE